jgi:hypothetical protein
MTDDNLTDVFNDSNDSVESKDTTEATETRGETKEVTSTEKVEAKTEQAEPPAAENKEELWTKKAVLDERKKRQALENELLELKKAKPNGEESKPAEISIEDRLWQERANTTREIYLDKHEDYEEMETLFLDMCKDNPALRTELRNSTNPAKFAYNQAKNHTEAKKLSDPEYVKKLEQEIYEKAKKEILAEVEAKQAPEDKRKKAALSVANISKTTSVNSNSSKESLETLDDMFDD